MDSLLCILCGARWNNHDVVSCKVKMDGWIPMGFLTVTDDDHDAQPPAYAELMVDADLDFFAIDEDRSWLWDDVAKQWIRFNDTTYVRRYTTKLTRVPALPLGSPDPLE